MAYATGAFGNTPLGPKLAGKQADGSYLTHNNQFVTPVGDVIKENGRPFGLALRPDGKTAASLNTGGATSGVVTIFDLVSHKVLQQTGTGKVANGGIVYSPDGKHLWAAEPANLVRFDVAPDGTLSNPVTVSLPGAGGRQAVPAGLAWAPNGTDLLVTLSANNTLAVVDTTTNTVVKQIPVGNVPNSVVVIDGKAYVSNQGGRPAQAGDKTDDSYGTGIVTNNQQAVPSTGTVSQVDLAAGRQTRTYKVGLQPSALLAVGKNLIVTNTDDDTVSIIDTAKQQVGRTFTANPATSHLGYNFVGTVQLVPTPTPKQMLQYTQQVFKNNQWYGLQQRNQRGNGKVAPVAVPKRIGDPSTIKHVFFIVKENRTYDQVLGDNPRGNGDPSLTQFGKKVTPNIHALADQYSLVDNMYSDGTNSAEGHHWLNQAFVNNYMQQMYGNYVRSYQTGDPMSNVKSGWIWDNALAHGKSVTNWGEQVDGYVDANGKGVPGGSWSQWLHDSQIMEGKASGSLHVPVGTYQPKTDIPSLQKVTRPDFPNFDMNIPDQYRTDLFQRDFAKYVKDGNLPALNMLWLPSNHTEGTAPGAPTPSAHVADNDLALGRMVDTISHSSVWKDSAIFVIEDDSQNGVDHVDGHRNVPLVISPYTARGSVVHTYYSQLNMMRTIEQILGLPPMNREDMAAEPMYDAFTNKPNFTPYTYQPNQIPLTATNPKPSQAPNATAAAWSTWSSKQNFASEDMANMAQENRDIWYATTNYTKPYPGDSKVLLPGEVPGGKAAPVKDSDG